MRPALRYVAVAGITCWAMAAYAFTFPQLTGRVVDQAHVLSPAAVQKLDTELAEEEQRSGNQLVVVTLDSLQGQTIEDYGYQLGRHWGIGQKGKNNGALLIVAPTEHKVRIEVGYGLEGTLTDAQSHAIIESYILPYFRSGSIEQGVLNGTDAIISVVGGQSVPAYTQPQHKVRDSSNTGVIIGALVLLFLFSQVLFFFVCIVSWVFGQILALFGFMGLLNWSRRMRDKIFPIDRILILWLLTPSHRVYGYRGGSSGGGFSGGGGSFGGGGSSGSW